MPRQVPRLYLPSAPFWDSGAGIPNHTRVQDTVMKTAINNQTEAKVLSDIQLAVLIIGMVGAVFFLVQLLRPYIRQLQHVGL